MQISVTEWETIDAITMRKHIHSFIVSFDYHSIKNLFAADIQLPIWNCFVFVANEGCKGKILVEKGMSGF
jgi:hypothetical protein